uniref:Uncharacterized protein n=1 Tax=Haptolina brevifila TaxID=156173 RepID=A0A7S2D2V9_9EUKA|mmetsp:Transcript_32297/g.64412  ORF Transcript_32297/g.64412 Transcript_32297/m.64412 type:complete len:184 (+) Transcript_32297:101-652(+)|eukprot:CAMPEP_0174704398 /NCGR_PEP_ID=MMETSP1094-20130205/8006_1 /TAXON_ID=156173 /ORGANISM="Chrysochromulina brevifilum, Strain UTEX LB 985" /LENGTH=183 /DNA_ID=CAMNT_0015902447 /DNA_START=46 /DNA_END=597 /DNA_ORIENTATION=-
MSDRIIKLVFIRVAGDKQARKACVPLVEGCDFEQFLQRVRRRLNLPDDAEPLLSDEATGVVDSIDRLLEVDEAKTLDVRVPNLPAPLPAPPVTCSTPNPSSAARGPAHHRTPHLTGPANGSALPECRLDVPTSEWARSGDHEDESGTLKYQKRRGVSLTRSRQLVVLLLVLVGVGFGVAHVLN